jgi:hypothetical protein
MSGTFIISFDCEGKWGIADCLEPSVEALFTTARLLQNYRDLLSILDEFGFRASFAFVGAYTLSPQAFLERRAEYEPMLSSPWCRPVAAALQRWRYDGWFNPEAPALVRRSGHEIAAHGFSHTSLGPEARRDVVRWELAALRRLELFRDRPLTFVYPRNEVGFVDELQSHGIVGYRDGRTPRGGRAASLLAEFNISGSAEPHARHAAVVSVPAGFFFNWRRGGRRMVPAAITIRRWRALLSDAAAHHRVVHLWSHPHNYLTGVGMLSTFREILRIADAVRRDQGLVNRTQLEYVQDVRR